MSLHLSYTLVARSGRAFYCVYKFIIYIVLSFTLIAGEFYLKRNSLCKKRDAR